MPQSSTLRVRVNLGLGLWLGFRANLHAAQLGLEAVHPARVALLRLLRAVLRLGQRGLERGGLAAGILEGLPQNLQRSLGVPQRLLQARCVQPRCLLRLCCRLPGRCQLSRGLVLGILRRGLGVVLLALQEKEGGVRVSVSVRVSTAGVGGGMESAKNIQICVMRAFCQTYR